MRPWRKPSTLWLTSGMWRSFHPQPLTGEEQRGSGHPKSYPVNSFTPQGLIIYFILVSAPCCPPRPGSQSSTAKSLSPAQEGRGRKGRGDRGPSCPPPGCQLFVDPPHLPRACVLEYPPMISGTIWGEI